MPRQSDLRFTFAPPQVISFALNASPGRSELPGEPRLLALTYSKGRALTEADFDHWETLKQSLRFA